MVEFEADVSIPMLGPMFEGAAVVMGILKEKMSPTCCCCCSNGGPPLDGRGIGDGERLSPKWDEGESTWRRKGGGGRRERERWTGYQ